MLILQARDQDGQPLGDQELRDELMTMTAAGYQTTAVSLAWAIEQLLLHPAALQRAEAEVRNTVGDGPMTADHLARLEYLDAAIKESLRIRPITAFIARKAREPFEVGGFEIPAGTGILPSAILTHFRRDVYPDPNVFDPERFLGRKPDPYAWFPFGGGR